MSHAALVLLRQLVGRTGLTARQSAALPAPDGGPDRGREFMNLACAIDGGARMISDFRVMGDHSEVLAPVASVLTAGRMLKEAAVGGDRTRRKITAVVNTVRRYAWSQVTDRHGQLPRCRSRAGIACIRLDATVVPAHSDKELAEPNFKASAIIPSWPNVTICASRWRGYAPGLGREQHRRGPPDAPRRGDRGAPAAVPAEAAGHQRRRLRSHDLIKRLEKLASRHGYQLVYSVGCAERTGTHRARLDPWHRLGTRD